MGNATSGSVSFQTQPLDLGVSDRNRCDDNNSNHSGSSGNHCNSPKRKSSTPLHYPAGSPVALDIKKKRVESPAPLSLPTPPLSHSPHHHTLNVPVNLQFTAVASPLISSGGGGGTTVPISEPPISVTPKPASEASGSDIPPSKSPMLITNSVTAFPCATPSPGIVASINNGAATTAATSIGCVPGVVAGATVGASATTTTIVAATTAPPATPNSTNPIRTNSADGLVRPTSENSSPAPAPSHALSIPSAPATPATPAKLPIEPEKSSSPGTKKSFFKKKKSKIKHFCTQQL